MGRLVSFRPMIIEQKNLRNNFDNFLYRASIHIEAPLEKTSAAQLQYNSSRADASQQIDMTLQLRTFLIHQHKQFQQGRSTTHGATSSSVISGPGDGSVRCPRDPQELQTVALQRVQYPNRYTKLDNLAWSQTVFLQFTFCRKRRFMKPLLLSSVAIFIHNIGCFFLHRHDTMV